MKRVLAIILITVFPGTLASGQMPGQFSLIEQVDFLNFTYPLAGDGQDCAGLGTKTVSLKTGKFTRRGGHLGVDVSLEKPSVQYADLTSDNNKEAVVPLICDPHGNYVDTVIFVYTLQNGSPVLLAKSDNTSTERDYKRFYPNGFIFPIAGVTVSNGRVIIDRPSDGSHACPENETHLVYKWNGRGFALAGKPMKIRNKGC